VVLLLVALLLAYPLSLGWVAWSSIDKVEAISSTTSTPGTTFLLVGSDSRAGLTDEQVGELATGTEAEAGGQRTDTILLLHVPSGGGPSVLVSLPRDSFVAIPGNGENKLNAAFAFGGPQLLVETVEGETGLGVDSYVETGFAGFASVVDALGGVDVCLEAPLSDPAAGIDLPAGCQQLTGPQALGFVRSRQTDATGDLARVQRQRQLLGGIVDETLDPALLLNPPRAYRTAGAGGGGLVVDEGTGPLDLGRFLLGMRSVSGPDGVQLTVPVSNPNLSTSAGSAVEWDAERSEQLFAALRADDTEQVRALVAQWTAEAEG
jgi:LCP family protein required for cell wall assembly